ncbi:hypothetical protein GOV12_06620 [Candidatus Pacearchaeota archaeon]|nr:hypothetical protein [Candidatus Pacearchaeota archaeon]
MKKVFEKKEVFVFVILCVLVLTPIVSASIFGEIVSVWDNAIDLIKELFGFGNMNEDLDGELGSLGAFSDSEERRFSSQGVLDDVPNPYAAYGLRRLSDSYSGPLIEVRRDSDDEVSDIGFNSSGDLDINGLESFCAGNCYVISWYDQTENADLNQTDEGLQPMIVVNGSVIVDDIGKPRIHFISDGLSGNSLIPINNHDLTAFFVQEADFTEKSKVILALGPVNNAFEWFQYKIRDWGMQLVIGSGEKDDYDLFAREGGDSMYPFLKTIQILDSNGQEMRVFSNRNNLVNYTNSRNQGITPLIHIGNLHRGHNDQYYDGFISEMILYHALSDSDRLKVYEDMNNHFQTGGAENINEGTLLPQYWQWEVDLYDWLENITEADVDLNLAEIEWDGTYSNISELEKLWIALPGGTSEYVEDHLEMIRSESKWWVLDDGNGSGIEGTGNTRFFTDASEAAFFYTQNLILSNGSQGNPYYNNDKLCRRAMISMAVSMMKNDELQTNNAPYMTAAMNIGGPMRGWVWAYRECKHVVDIETQKAFEQGFRIMTKKILVGGPQDVNGNIDTHAVASFGHLYNIFSDLKDKDLVLRTTKKILFGTENGTPETVDQEKDFSREEKSLYNQAGYIDEGDSPETTYNGASLINILQAQAETRDYPEWDFMDIVIRSMLDFKLIQYFKDPDGFLDGPSGYSSRTGGSYVKDQRTIIWRDYTAAATFVEGKPLARYGRKFIMNESEMVSLIIQAIDNYNSEGTGNISNSTAPGFRFTRFPAENVYFPESNWHSTLKALVDSNNPITFTPYERVENINKIFDYEFWAYKNNHLNQDFGFFIETLENPGRYSGWYGGSLQTFWTKNGGMVILARHGKSGDGDSPYPPPYENYRENTRVWKESVYYDVERNRTHIYGIDRWATHHIWGRDENNSAFSTAASNQHDKLVNYNFDNTSVSVQSILGNSTTFGQETGNEINGIVTITNNFTAISNGLLINNNIRSNQSDEITELWVTLPVFLRDAQQPLLDDTTIEYWNSDNWLNLTTNLVGTGKIRLGRDFNNGNGSQYVYVLFDRLRNMKLSDVVYRQYSGGNSRIRNIHIDLHGSSGSEIMFPALREITYAITTTPEVGDIVYGDIPLGSPPVTNPSSSGSSPGGSPGGSGNDLGVDVTEDDLNESEGDIEAQFDEGEVNDFSDENETDEDNGLDVEEGKSSNNLVYYIIIGVVLLLVVLVIIYVFFIKRKGGNSGGSNSGSSKIFKKKEVSRANKYVDMTSKKLK